MSGVLISEASETDLPELLALYALLHPHDPALAPDQAAETLARLGGFPGSAVLLARQGAVLVASLTLIIIPNLTRGGAPYALIENVITHPDHRKQGHGTALLQAATDRAWANACFKVMLMTGSKNPATLRFYEQAGFEQSKTGFQIRHR